MRTRSALKNKHRYSPSFSSRPICAVNAVSGLAKLKLLKARCVPQQRSLSHPISSPRSRRPSSEEMTVVLALVRLVLPEARGRSWGQRSGVSLALAERSVQRRDRSLTRCLIVVSDWSRAARLQETP